MADSAPTPPRDAASVILLRERACGFEVFLLRRHRKSSFMSSAYVFPGGAADPGEDDLRITAARELFEEAGVLLADRPVADAVRARWRAALHEGASLAELLAEENAALDTAALDLYAHWITPSVEPKRFSARFYLARLPDGQTPSFDNRETTSEAWVSPREAIERASELKLPPPQLFTMHELVAVEGRGVDAAVAFARDRAGDIAPITPRAFVLEGGRFELLLPWDPQYDAATGEGDAIAADHPLACDGSRFAYQDGSWKLCQTPASQRAE